MSNIISFAPKAKVCSEFPRAQRISNLAQSVALHRRSPEDVFWLKENAEFLGWARSTAARLGEIDLELYDPFYFGVRDRLAFFPQYYRMLLSITLDLEDLGYRPPNGGVGADELCHFAATEGLVEAELSDLQRAEAAWLLARRGFDIEASEAVTDRLLEFASRSATFAIPNRKAAYELTHIVFYLTRYGSETREFDQKIITSLIYAGIIAYLEENADLMAEICLALRFAGATPPRDWEHWLASVRAGFRMARVEMGGQDDYHTFLMCLWHGSMSEDGVELPSDWTTQAGFVSPVSSMGALRDLSVVLCNLGDSRVEDWSVMMSRVMSSLDAGVCAHLHKVCQSTPFFESFFAHFARTRRAHVAATDVHSPQGAVVPMAFTSNRMGRARGPIQ